MSSQPLSKAQKLANNIGKSNIQTCISGKDIIYEVQTGATTFTSAVITSVVNISPLTLLSGTRLQQFAPLFQRYRFKKFILRYLPIVNVQYNGNACVAYMADPTQELSGSGLPLMQSLTQMAFRSVVPCWRSGSFSVKASDMVFAAGAKYCCDPTEESDSVEKYQGTLYFISDNLVTVNTLYGRWELDWEVEFYDPIITKANNGTYLFGGSSSDCGLSKPWGSSMSTLLGDASLATLSTNGTDSLLTLPDNGQYFLTVYYPLTAGGAGLTNSTVTSNSVGITFISGVVQYCDAQVGKLWVYQFYATDGAVLAVHDTSGTHPSGSARLFLCKVGPGQLPSALNSKKALGRKISELEKKLEALTFWHSTVEKSSPFSLFSPPPFPAYPSPQVVEGTAQSSTETVGVITDGNSPPKDVEILSSASSAIGPLIAPVLKKKKKLTFVQASDEEDSVV